jgi:SAM-dependent methyltransferase
MIETPDELSALTDELALATWTMTALGLLFETGLADLLAEPRTLDELTAARPAVGRERIARCLAVMHGRGVLGRDDADADARYWLAPGVRPYLEPPLRPVLEGDYRTTLMQPRAFLDACRRGASRWDHADPAVLQAQGDGSGMFAVPFRKFLVAQLGDLADRLAQPTARFLDVGVGVGALAVAMCREFPALRVVGLDVLEAPLALARDNIAAAGLADRIELRRVAIQELAEEAAFDLAWLPASFLAEALPNAIERVRAALRPGGWVLMPTLDPTTRSPDREVWSFMMASWGGVPIEAPDAESLLVAAGFRTRVMPGTPWRVVVGER